MSEFAEFPKLARYSRECIVTEKIDGTNAQVFIAPETDDLAVNRLLLARNDGLMMLAGSRTQYITPERDNHGFARWVQEHADELWALGPGRHFGEWWGSGIQRGYGLTKGEKRFSLFNVARWHEERDREKYPAERPACCYVVPVLKQCGFDYINTYVEDALESLRTGGSWAAPGFMKPEGVVVFHVAGNVAFKKTLEKDDEPKSRSTSRPAADAVGLSSQSA